MKTLKNKSWDEWVPANRVLKMSDENLKLQKELLATHGYLHEL